MPNLDRIKSNHILELFPGLLGDNKVIKLFKYNKRLRKRIGFSFTLIYTIKIRIGNNVIEKTIVNNL